MGCDDVTFILIMNTLRRQISKSVPSSSIYHVSKEGLFTFLAMKYHTWFILWFFPLFSYSTFISIKTRNFFHPLNFDGGFLAEKPSKVIFSGNEMKKGESQNNSKYRYGILYLRGWMRVTANQKFLGKHIYIKKIVCSWNWNSKKFLGNF